MSRRLPLVDAKTMEKVLFALGFTLIRQKGSHAFYRHSDGRTTTLPHQDICIKDRHSAASLAPP